MTELKLPPPPRWPLKILRFFMKEHYLEEIEGDLEEIFREHTEQFSSRKARRLYALEALKLLRPVLMKNLEGTYRLNHYGMFKNYIKVSFRGLIKSPLNASINIFGLSAAIGICVFAFSFVQWTVSRDQFHKNKNSVYLVTFFANREGSLQQYGTTPRPLGEMLRHDFAQVTRVCRMEDRSAIVKYETHVFNESIRFTEPEFLDMFTFPLRWGSAASLTDLNSIILSEDMSLKYFGEQNPVGLSILVKTGSGEGKAFKIGGVAKRFPSARSIGFDFLVNLDNLKSFEQGYDFNDWQSFVSATLIQVDSASALHALQLGMGNYLKLQNQSVTEDWAIASFAFEPLATLHLRTDNIRNDIARAGSTDNYQSMIFMAVISVLMLTLACVNYINIAIASAAKRLRELGVRKSIGASRPVIIIQFLTEHLVLATFALLVGVALGTFVIIPWFEGLWHFSMDFTLLSPTLWIFLAAVLVTTAIASGIYPALYVSKFQAVDILKGTLRFGHKNLVTKVFLGFQLVLACLFITSAIMFTQNTDFLTHRPWGYSNRDVVYAEVPDGQAYEQLSAVMVQRPDVVSISGSRNHVGKNHQPVVLHFPDREYEADLLAISPGYFATLGLSIKAGRVFNDHEKSDRHAVLVNELLVQNLAWDQAIGKTFTMDSIEYEVIGVVRNFHNYSLSNLIRPMVFTVADKSEYRFISVKVRPETEDKSYDELQESWAALFPETPFLGGYQEDVWGNFYTSIEIHGHVWRVFAVIAILLAGLGLYGLISYNVAGRTKEFSIRKVLGASLKNISANIINPYVLLFATAVAIGTPLSFFVIRALIESSYAYHMPVTFWSAGLASFLVIVVLLVTASVHVWKVMRSSPVDGLKED